RSYRISGMRISELNLQRSTSPTEPGFHCPDWQIKHLSYFFVCQIVKIAFSQNDTILIWHRFDSVMDTFVKFLMHNKIIERRVMGIRDIFLHIFNRNKSYGLAATLRV